MTNEEQIARAKQAQQALDQFLTPAFAVLQAAYAERLQEIAVAAPWETDKIRKLAAGLKIAKEVEAQIIAVVKNGEFAEAQKKRADRIAGLSDTKKSILRQLGERV
jgi:hypothetical protein